MAAPTVTLTFDNGPDAEATPLVLYVLRRRGLRATFFVIGNRLEDPALRSLAERADAKGHWIGNHTYSHAGPLGQRTDPAHAEAEIGRTQTLPQVPTMLELGLAGFVVEGWWALYLPAAAPREVVDRINAATNAWLRSAEALETLRNQGVAALGGTPEDLAARTAAEVAKWREVVRDARIEPG